MRAFRLQNVNPNPFFLADAAFVSHLCSNDFGGIFYKGEITKIDKATNDISVQYTSDGARHAMNQVPVFKVFRIAGDQSLSNAEGVCLKLCVPKLCVPELCVPELCVPVCVLNCSCCARQLLAGIGKEAMSSWGKTDEFYFSRIEDVTPAGYSSGFAVKLAYYDKTSQTGVDGGVAIQIGDSCAPVAAPPPTDTCATGDLVFALYQPHPGYTTGNWDNHGARYRKARVMSKGSDGYVTVEWIGTYAKNKYDKTIGGRVANTQVFARTKPQTPNWKVGDEVFALYMVSVPRPLAAQAGPRVALHGCGTLQFLAD